jgi:tetratricopeptide (TPR) repeat protein
MEITAPQIPRAEDGCDFARRRLLRSGAVCALLRAFQAKPRGRAGDGKLRAVKRDSKAEADAATRANAREWEEVEEAVELLHDERFQDALYALRDVIKQNPKNAYAYYFLGVALFETAQAEPARDAYRAAIKLAPEYLGARVSLSHVLRMLGDLRGAIAEAEEALRKAPGDADALHAAGLAHAARGDNAAARRYLNAFLASNPEFETATEVRSILATLGRADD